MHFPFITARLAQARPNVFLFCVSTQPDRDTLVGSSTRIPESLAPASGVLFCASNDERPSEDYTLVLVLLVFV